MERGLSGPSCPHQQMCPHWRGANTALSQMQKEQQTWLKDTGVVGEMQIFRVGEIAIGKTWAQDLFISQALREIINKISSGIEEV